jgi:adenylate cyclase
VSLPPRRPRLLVVDDDAPTREALIEGLSDEGFVVVAAEEGAQALEMMIETRPDVVLLDLMMPGMNGWEVLDEMKARPALRDIPVVIVTASRHVGKAPWGYPIWVKPLKLDPLTRSILTLLR